MSHETDGPAFPSALRRRLNSGKYTKWAADLSEGTLESLLWMIGEYALRASTRREFPDAPVDERRMAIGLENVTRIVDGERFDLEEAKDRIRRGLR